MNNLTFRKFLQIQQKGYTLDMIFLLMKRDEFCEGTDAWGGVKITALLYTMKRKGLITEDEKITLDGQALLDFYNSESKEEKIVKRKVEDEFDRFWKTFPATDSFKYGGKTFQGSRALRINKEECKLKLRAILNEGEHSIDQIIEAIEFDIKLKMENSIKTNTNKLTFVQNSLTYLKQRSYEPFIELISQGTIIKESTEPTIGETYI